MAGISRVNKRSAGPKRRAGRGGRGGRRPNFSTTRLGETLDNESELDESLEDAKDESDSGENQTSSGEESDEVSSNTRPYNALLQSFQVTEPRATQPQKKRRRLNNVPEEEKSVVLQGNDTIPSGSFSAQDTKEDHLDEEAEQAEEQSDEDSDEEVKPFDDDDEDDADPFEVHFAKSSGEQLSEKLKAIENNQWNTVKLPSILKAKIQGLYPGNALTRVQSELSSLGLNDLKLKHRLTTAGQRVLKKPTALEEALVPLIFDYQDVLYGARTPRNINRLRGFLSLHALNHIFKTRDRIIKNNGKLSRNKDAELELRDQGFTRPTVLILTETRSACAKWVQTLLNQCSPDQQENKKRFEDYYISNEQNVSEDRPEDFQELFSGNDDNEFRVGLQFTRKSVKFFSQFYKSDIIFASPLGLRRAIDNKDAKKRDSDFLSSIEMVIIDQADAILMQNWEHIEYVFDHLNQQPKEAHDCDFGRVREWYLDGHAGFLRQTIVLSAYNTPELNHLFSKHMRNVSGKVKYQEVYDGEIENIGQSLKQTFSRFDSASVSTDPEHRFKYFTSAIVPSITKVPKAASGGSGILVFIPSYFDFVRLRNYFANSTATQNISFGAISEYTDATDTRKARSHFISGRHSVLLYTGRAHHFRRYNIRGVKRIVMYALPENPIFYREFVSGYLGVSIGTGEISPQDAAVRVLFSKWDVLRLERVVGSKRVGGMVRERTGDTFDFV